MALTKSTQEFDLFREATPEELAAYARKKIAKMTDSRGTMTRSDAAGGWVDGGLQYLPSLPDNLGILPDESAMNETESNTDPMSTSSELSTAVTGVVIRPDIQINNCGTKGYYYKRITGFRIQHSTKEVEVQWPKGSKGEIYPLEWVDIKGLRGNPYRAQVMNLLVSKM